MVDNAGKLFIFNNSVEKSENIGNIYIPEKNVVYEVIRIIKNVPLFWEDHYSRLNDSMDLIGIELELGQQEIRKSIVKLVAENGLSNCNVKLVLFADDVRQNLLLYVSKSYYPSEQEFEKGVGVSLLQLERDKPNAKLVVSGYKEKVTRKIEEDGVFEVLLVNRDNKITEGSKSNVFFVKGKKIYTAPGEYVLKGITRQYIIDTCERLGYEVFITLIGVDLLKDMDGLFISGTSIKVLPVSKVDGIAFKSASNATITAVKKMYDHIIDEYVKNNLE